MQGQFTIWDNDKPARPCEYRFRRYIGQRVRCCGMYCSHYGETGTIKEIKPYYTIWINDSGKEVVGTPVDLEEET